MFDWLHRRHSINAGYSVTCILLPKVIEEFYESMMFHVGRGVNGGKKYGGSAFIFLAQMGP